MKKLIFVLTSSTKYSPDRTKLIMLTNIININREIK